MNEVCNSSLESIKAVFDKNPKEETYIMRRKIMFTQNISGKIKIIALGVTYPETEIGHL